jgi:hypothetical protein
MAKRYPSGIIGTPPANSNSGMTSVSQQVVAKPALLNVLVIGGGGGGGQGGGGAGGFAETTVPFAKGTFVVTIGAGGLGWDKFSRANSNGNNSVFQFGTTVNLTTGLTAFGGGKGHVMDPNFSGVQSTGGSGGGAGGFGEFGAAGTTNQGNSGGKAGTASNGAAGGGGGAGAAGVNNSSTST